jgi:hypothetical protein
MKIMLHAIVDFYDEPYEETCLCDGHFTEFNRNWHELSYGTKARWREFTPQLKNTEYAQLNCTICGFPIGTEKE